MIFVNNNENDFIDLQKECGFKFIPCEKNYDFDDTNRFKKIKQNAENRSFLNAVLQQLPLLYASDIIGNAYKVKFPDGIPHTLTKLKQGGFGSLVLGKEGKIVGHASFMEMKPQAALLTAFSLLSIATSQYYLQEIKTDLNKINQKLDKILEFLYGEKKAELMSEINFVKYACDNFHSISNYDSQRIATISNLQNARIIAMKDVDFYINDLDSIINSDTYKLNDKVKQAFKSKNSLELSLQLHLLSTALEVCYSNNYEEEYISYLNKDLTLLLTQTEKKVLTSFSELRKNIDLAKDKKIINKNDVSPENKKRVNDVVERLQSGEITSLKNKLGKFFDSTLDNVEYYLSNDGNIYLESRG